MAFDLSHISGPEVPPPCKGKRWVISDIHGCAHTLERLLTRIDPGPEDYLFFLGDYVNKGPDSAGVLDLIMDLEASGIKVFALRGNHDEALLNGSTADTRSHMPEGKSLFEPDGSLKKKYADWLSNLPLAYDLGDYLLVHAGFNFSLLLPFADVNSQMNIRGFPASRFQTKGRRIVHGHNPKPASEIRQALESNALVIPLDNGCVYFGERPGMGHLIALELNSQTWVEEQNAEPSFSWRTYIPEIKSLPPMETPSVSTLPILEQLEAIRKQVDEHVVQFQPEIAATHPRYRASARNLLHYLALRQHDIRDLQNRLGELGVTRLGRAESYTLATLVAVTNNLRRMNDLPTETLPIGEINFREGTELLRLHATELLAPQSHSRSVRIMVTLATEAAHNYALVKQLLEAEVNCVRINCAHDHAAIWKSMIAHVRRASQETGKPCLVAMDLGGPKLRTGRLSPGPQVMKFKPEKDVQGRVTAPFLMRMVPEEETEQSLPGIVPVAQEFLAAFRQGDRIYLHDARGKRRSLEVVETGPHGCSLSGEKTTYFRTGLPLQLFHKGKPKAHGATGPLPVAEIPLMLNTGDSLVLHLDENPGENARMRPDGTWQPAHISCPVPELYQQVKIGEKVLIDDGEIEGIIEAMAEESVTLRITFARPGGSKLRADKGINLPYSDLHLDGLTAKDREDLVFVAQNADIVNVSFVNNSRDVLDLLDILEKINAPADLGVILKIETLRGFTELPAILLAGMRRPRLGVMIARGDLAVEAGWNLLAEVQEEILRVCEAGHIPIVWATQVLESLAKTGRPSRAEITDAAMGQRAECVMLNKGPYILEAVKMLHDILSSMQNFRQKKAPMLPMLKTPSLV